MPLQSNYENCCLILWCVREVDIKINKWMLSIQIHTRCAIPPGSVNISIGSWGVNRHTVWCTSAVSVILHFRLEPGVWLRANEMAISTVLWALMLGKNFSYWLRNSTESACDHYVHEDSCGICCGVNQVFLAVQGRAFTPSWVHSAVESTPIRVRRVYARLLSLLSWPIGWSTSYVLIERRLRQFWDTFAHTTFSTDTPSICRLPPEPAVCFTTGVDMSCLCCRPREPWNKSNPFPGSVW